MIPNGLDDNPQFNITCENYATRNQYVRENVAVFGICELTERVRARAWCECDDVEPACTLTCDDGNPPPDLAKTDPIYFETCARFAYEYTTLTADECQDPVTALNFDAKAFCCNEPEPDNCSICPDGTTLADVNKQVQTEFFGDATCGEIDTYASYLPSDACDTFVFSLLDNHIDGEFACCVSSSTRHGPIKSFWVASLVALLFPIRSYFC